MEELDLSGLKNLTRAYCNHGQLKRVYIYGCTSLELLGLEGNDIEFLDIREAPQLKYLYYPIAIFDWISKESASLVSPLKVMEPLSIT